MVVALLTDPDGFFARHSEDPGFLGPVVVAIIAGIAGIAAALPAIRFTIAAMPPEARAFGGIAYVSAIVGGIVGPFVRWLLFAVAFYAVATVAFDPPGRFRDLTALVGWGLVPTIPSVLLSGYASYVVYGGVSPPDGPMAAATFAQNLRGDPAFVVAGLVGLAFLVWSGLLWTFAVRHALSLRIRQALITVAIPVSVAAIWRLYGLVG